MPATRSRIEFFLEQFFDAIGADNNKTMPALYKVYANSLSHGNNGHGLHGGSGSNTGNNGNSEYDLGGSIDQKLPPDVLAMFKNREEKLVRFSRAIIDITSDLLSAIESGVNLDQSFLTNFKGKFDFFRGALPAINAPENLYKSNPPPPLMIEEGKEDKNVSNGSGKNGRHSAERRHSNVQSAQRVKRKKRLREVDIHALNFEEIVSDLFSKVHEVENFLIESLELSRPKALKSPKSPGMGLNSPGKEDSSWGVGGGGSVDEVKHAAMTKYAVSSAMAGSSLACTLAHMIVRPDKEDQPQGVRESAVNVLIQCDILGVVKRSRRRASIERMEPDTSNWAQLIITSMRNEGVVGFIDSLRSYIPVQQASVAAAAAAAATAAANNSYHDNSNSNSNNNNDPNISASIAITTIVATNNSSSTALLEASQCLCESLYRLVVAIGGTDAGREYLHTYGSELTSHTIKLLILLPSSFNYKEEKTATAVFSDGALEGSSVSFLDSISDSVTSLTDRDKNDKSERNDKDNYNDNRNGNERKLPPNDLHQDQDPASSLRLWCILALTVLSAQKDGGTETYANEEVMRAVQRVVGVVKKDNLQLVAVEDGALEWLNEAFFSLLMEILAAAFSGNAVVIRAAAGNDSLAIGMAALSLDVRRQSIGRMSGMMNGGIGGIGGNGVNGGLIGGPMRRESNGQVLGSGVGVAGRKGSIGGQWPFSISSTTCESVPQELLVLLDLCLGMLLFAARSREVQRVLTSTTNYQELCKSLLKTLFRLVLLPQLTQSLADSILVILNVLFRDDMKIRELAKDLKEIVVVERKVSLGGLKWFQDTTPLRDLLARINEARHDNNLSNRENYDHNGSHDSYGAGAGGAGAGGGLRASEKSRIDASDFIVTSLADLALSKVMVTQTYATDNIQLIEYLRKQKGFTGRMNTSLLYQ